MFKVEAIIQPFRLSEVRKGLVSSGVQGMSVLEIKGAVQDEWHMEHYRGSQYQIDLEHKLMIRVIVPEASLADVLKIIQRTGKTGKLTNGSICVSRIEDLMGAAMEEALREAS